MTPIKVAVLGGGAGALAAAEALTATPELRDRYEVTVHTLGWRLGGKGASGRNAAAHQRIEEHGLHIWFGFYDNAFALMQRAYGELARPADAPLATWRDAFTPCDELVLAESWNGTWRTRRFQPPTNDLEPGTEADEFFWPAALTVTGWLLELWVPQLRVPALDRLPGFSAVRQAAGGVLISSLKAARDLAASVGLIQTDASPAGRRATLLQRALRTAKHAAWRMVATPLTDDEDEADMRFALTSLDLAVTIISGIIDDELVDRGFETVDDEEFHEWLRRHGAEELTLENSSLLRALYDLAFGYEDGNPAKPNIAAGEALQALIRIALTYKGSMLWKMNAGMGDVVFTPLYEVLKERGVKFEFFSRVDALRLSTDTRDIEQVEITRQITLADPSKEYQPLVDVGGLGCWPSEPLWDQIDDGATLAASQVNLESESAPTAGESVTLERGTDFDHVVLGIAVGSLHRICGDLAADEANPRFGRMLANSKTVATQAFQIWLDRPLSDLGWSCSPTAILGSFADPLDTLCDMSHLIGVEGHPEGSVADIGYFCGVMTDEPGEDAATARARVATAARAHLADQMPSVLLASPEFDWEALVSADGEAGPDRFNGQYWRANTEGSERYVQTPKGSVVHRLWPHESGYRNLVLAGDWTRNGIDGGSVEAAVTSGLLAAKAISGYPDRVPGSDGVLSARRETRGGFSLRGPTDRPKYIDYGSLMTPPASFTSLQTTLYGFWVEADQGKLDQLCHRIFAEPSGGEVDYRPLGKHIMITWGDIARVISHIEPYDSYGAVAEPQVSVWVPTAAVDRMGPIPIARRFSMFVPYIWLDNAMSLATGRELFGWPKAWGWPTFPAEDGSPMEWGLDVFGLTYGPDEIAKRHDGLLRVKEVASGGLGPEITTLEGLAKHAAADLLSYDPSAESMALPGLEFATSLAEDINHGRMREVFLKQFRTVEDGTDACLQQIVEASTSVVSMSARTMLGTYELEVKEIDSHPITRELGVKSQTIPLAYRCELDFDVGEGAVLWDARG